MQERHTDIHVGRQDCDGDRDGSRDAGRDGLHRIIDAAVLGSDDLVPQRRPGLLTGLSIVVSDDDPDDSVTAAIEWAPPAFRVEFVLRDPSPATTARLDVLAWPWRAVAVPDGRAAALDAATAVSAGEFVVVASGPRGGTPAPGPMFEHLRDALGLMWVNGADALVLGPFADAPPFADVTAVGSGPDARPERLAAALGLRNGGGPTLVVLRRWVARFLFDEIGLAIDPMDEFADRVRLLELRLLEVLGRP